MDNKINKKRAVSRSKKVDKISMINFGVIFCTVFSLIYVVGLLLVASFAGNGRSGMASISTSLKETVCPQVSGTGVVSADSATTVYSTDGEEAANVVISMDDGGYNQKFITISLKSSHVLAVNNQGVNPHSFVIPDLNVDSGAIAPGKAKTISLEGMGFKIRKYDFYSNIGNDDTFIFGGVIDVVE